MNTQEILAFLTANAIQARVVDGNLKFKGPKGVLTDAVLEHIRRRKDELVAALEQGAHDDQGRRVVARKAADGPCATTFAQQRLWFLDQLDRAASVAYHIPAGLRLKGRLDRAALRRTLDALVARHESLRTRFVSVDGQPAQVIDPASCGFALRDVDLSTLDASQRDEAVTRVTRAEAIAPFDLSAGPLIRGQLLRLADDDHVLLVTQHHIVSDGWSIAVLVRELSALYAAFCEGRDDPLPPLSIQYADYAAWQRQWLQGDVLHTQTDFWRAHLAGAPALLELPADHPRPAVQSYRGRRLPLALDAARTNGLRALARRHGVTPFMVLLGAWSALLSRLSGQRDLVIGTPVANRLRAEVEPLIGLFVNTLALRVRLDDDPTVAQLLAQIKTTMLAAQAHQDLPFEQVVEALKPARSLGHSPIFQVMLSLDNTPASALDLPGLTLTPLPTPRDTTQFDLSLSLTDAGETIAGYLEYASDLFDDATIERHAGHFLTLLDGLFADDAQPVSRLPLLTDAQRRQLLVDFNDTAVDYPQGQLIHQLFEAQAAIRPDAIALVHGDATLSYDALNRRANRVAHRLLAQGLQPDDRVAICVERGLDMVVGLLGILKAGGAYVPLDPTYPAERLNYMLDDSAPVAIVTQRGLQERLGNTVRPTLVLDAIDPHESDDGNPDTPDLHERHLAYLIYTSGSTGQPKGVMVEHRNAVNLIRTHADTCEFTADDRVLQFASFSFDASVAEIFTTLSTGACLVLRPENLRAPDAAFLAFLAAQRITVADVPTAFWQQWAAQPATRVRIGDLRLVVVGGEKAERRTLEAWFADHAPASSRWLNVYGPTEATVQATAMAYAAGDALPAYEIPIGRPIANVQIHICDAHGALVPIGVAGEIHIGGVGLARGYLDRAALTAERFAANPFDDTAGARLYRTGDLGRRLPDGTIEYLGRNDAQVKIRGYRIEPGEIEARLLDCAGVREAVVLARQDVPGENRLVAYLRCDADSPVSLADVRAQLAASLPDHMLPSAFVQLSTFPVTVSGKIDRRALPAPDRSAVVSRDYEAPAGATETAVARVWAELLGLERVGRLDDFFALGGHSLLAVQLASRLRAELGIEVALRDLFSHPTLAGFAQAVADAANSTLSAIPVDDAATKALSFSQQRLWFLDQLDRAASVAYHIPAGLRLKGRLDRAALRRTLDALVARHESLRTRFVSVDGQPAQVIDPASCGFALRDVDLSTLDAPERDAEVVRVTRAEAIAPFDLSAGPLIRGQLLRLADDDHVLLVTQHHIVSDGWSIAVLVRELSALYAAFCEGRDDPLPPLSIQYADYAAWQRQWLQGDVLHTQTDFWRAHLAGAPALLELPADHPRPAVQSYRGRRLPLALDAARTNGLRALARRHGVTPFMVLLGAWSALLSRLSGQRDLVIGTPVANRLRAEVEPLIGLFVNTLALRVRLDDDPTVAQLLAQIKTTMLAAQAHQDLPFEQVVEALKPARSLGHSPIFQVMLSLDNTPASALDLPGLTLTPLPTPRDTTQFDLSLSLTDAGETIAGYLEYASDLFDDATIERHAGHFLTLLDGLFADDAQPVSRLPLLTDVQRRQLLVDFNDTAVDYPQGQLIHRLFEAQAAARPDAIALVHGDAALSYDALNRRANRVAHRLLAQGLQPDDRVAICVERGLDMVVGLLGILKAGGAYVPLDPTYPAERLNYMLDDSAPVAIVTQRDLQERLGNTVRPTLVLDAVDPHEGDDGNPDTPGLHERHLAYLIYTSGSTGQPKGVMVEHRNVVRLALCREFDDLDASSVVAQVSNASFDAATYEIWGTLLKGGRLVHVDKDCLIDPVRLATQLRADGIGVFWVTTAVFNRIAAQAPDCLAALDVVGFGGEAASLAAVERIVRHGMPRRLFNYYGPTENTTFSTRFEIDAATFDAGAVLPIGTSMAWTRTCVLDEIGQPVPIGVTGELYVGGPGLARGYFNRPQLTAERFVANPFADDGEERLYRTGDLVCRLPDGNLRFVGRNDGQIKLRGFRIETGEIEARLTDDAGVRDAAVVLREDSPGDRRLVAYFVDHDGRDTSIADLRAALSAALPDYMLPSAFVRLASLPLTPNGKVDRRALPAPDASAIVARDYAAPLPGLESTLARIWQDLLGLPRVGRHDHFFELGGHSLLVVSLIERLRLENIAAAVRSVFAAPTLSGLAAAIADGDAATAVDVPPNRIPPGCTALTPDLLPLANLSQTEIDAIVAATDGGAASIQDVYPLSPLQEGILFHHLIENEGDAYLLRSVVAFDSRARLDRFLRAVQTVIDRHDILRSSLRWVGLAQPVQVVHRAASLPLVELDAPEGGVLDALLARTDPRKVALDLTRAPLMAASVAFDAASGEWLLSLVHHHVVCDHVTLELMLAEVRALLDDRADSLPTSLPYRDFIAQTASVPMARHETYFRDRLGDVSEPTAPFGVLDVQGDGNDIAEARVPLDDDLAARVRDVARRRGVSAAVLFHLAWAHVLARCSGRDDVVFGTVLSGRLQGSAGADRVLGMFINTLPVRIDLADLDLDAALSETWRRLGDLVAHEQAPLALAQRCSGVAAPLPLFTTLFNYRHSHDDIAHGEATGAPVWPGMRVLFSEERTNYPLTFSVDDLGRRFMMSAHCLPGIDPHRMIGYVATTLEALVRDLVGQPRRKLGDIDILPAAERRTVLEDFNAQTQPDDARLIHQQVEAQAQERPGAVAVRHRDASLSYAELNARANRVAHRLLALGVKPDDRVAVCFDRGIAMVVALLGILKAGAAYVPLDPAYPAERLAHMLGDSAPAAWLTQADMPARLPVPASATPVLLLDADGACDGSSSDDANPIVAGRDADRLAYVIYTSGSTGTPKGVAMPQRGLMNLLQWQRGSGLHGDADARTLQFAALGFDVAFQEIFSTLCSGECLVLVDEALRQDPAELVRFVQAERIRKVFLPFIALQNFADAAARLQAGLPYLKHVVTAGEQLRIGATIAQLFRQSPHLRLHNHYGPTETHVVTAHTLAADASGWPALPPIGRPVANAKLYILDRARQPVPLGATGEIYIGGDAVARGYLNRPELTAERFVADPHAGGDARMYKTGDVGRWLPDGTIEFQGRNDFQVKIRGFRVEPGDIESRLGQCRGVREATVLAREDGAGGHRLVAYFIAHDAATVSVADLRAEIAAALPEHMVPGAFVQLERYPLTANGKLDRNALPEPDATAVASRAYEAPLDGVETTLATIWQDLLGLDRVGRRDHFFELGGHSLLVIGLIERLRQQGIAASVRSVFNAPVLADLAAALSDNADVPADAVPANAIPAGCTAIEPRMLPLIALGQDEIDAITARVAGGAANVQDIYPLSPLQEGILFHHLLETAGDAYLLRWVLAFDTRPGLDAFLAALQTVIDRHDILRSAIAWAGLSQPAQVVLRHAPLAIDEFEPANDALDVLLARTDPRGIRIDLSRAPLLSASIVADARSGQWMLALLCHHVVIDHYTIDLIMDEVRTILHGDPAALPAPLPYRNFIAQTRSVPTSGHEAYFREQLGDIDAPTALFDRLDVQGDGLAIREVQVPLDGALAARIRTTARQAGVSAAVLFHVAWAQVLAQCTGRDDVVFGTVLSGRLQGSEGADRVLGMFINTLPVRVALGGRSVHDAVTETYRRLTELLVHEQASLALAQRCSGVAAPTPLFNSLLNYRHSTATADAAARWPGMHFIRGEDRTNYPITLSVDDQTTGFEFTTQCVGDIDPVAVSAYLSTALASLVDALSHSPTSPVRALNILPADERARLLAGGSADAQTTGEPALIHRLFEQQAAIRPDAIALTFGDATLSYGELNLRANRLAHRLIALGVRPDDRVAICVERGFGMLVGVLGILKAGAAYVPLDPIYPSDRLAFVLDDCKPVAVLVESALQAQLFDGGLPSAPVLVLDDADTQRQLAAQPEHDPDVADLRADHLAYVIYTSGSTGQPKGVMVEHGHVTRLFAVTQGEFYFDDTDVWTLFHSFAFDFSVWEIWGALFHGGRLVIVPGDVARSAPDFYTLLCRERVTVLNQTPSAFRQLIAAQAAQPAEHTLRCVVFGGEALELHTLAPWFARNDAQRTQLVNMYGITEITVHATFRAIGPADVQAGLGSVIGAPLGDLAIYVLDANRQPVPTGVSGELYVGGAGVARGYLNRPALTAERFIADPFRPNGKLYKTGDLGRRLPDGTLEYLGRNDFQVKIRGFRIELGEIEAKLAACDGVREAVVIAREDVPGDKRLVAYLVAQAELSLADLRHELAQSLPDYMLPSAFVTLDALPLTANGKLDRKALPAPDQTAVVTRVYHAPVGRTEEAIAAIWQDLLGLDRIGRDDHFFELGGHSLLVVSLIERLRQAGLSASVRQVFTAPTLAALAAAIGNDTGSAFVVPPNRIAADCTAITPDLLPLVDLTQAQIDAIVASVPQGVANIQDIYPLAPLQEGILFHHLLQPQGDAYLLRSIVSFDRRERLDAFLVALQRVIDRHDILRSAMRWTGLPQPVQVVHRHAPLPVATLTADTSDAMAQLLAHTSPAHARMDLTRAPLMAATCIASGSQWLLALQSHHIIEDNYSLQLMLGEVHQLLVDANAPLPPSLPYRNFIAQARSVPADEHEAYFRTQLADIDAPTAPFGLLQAPAHDTAIREADVSLDPALAERVRHVARRQGVSAAVLFHAAWAQVLAVCTGRDAVVFGTTLSGRLQGSAGADRVLGMFINTLPMRLDVGACTAQQLVTATYRRLGELLVHEQASLALAQRASGVSAPMPLFTALLNYRHTRLHGTAPWDGIRLIGGEERTNYPLTVSINDLGDGFGLSVQCIAGMDAGRIAAYLTRALDGLVAALTDAPDRPAHTLDILPDDERALLLDGFNDTRVDYPTGLLIHQLVERQARQQPDATAVVFAQETLGYAELNRRANRLAHRLIALGIQPDDRVAICIERSLDMVVGLLGILKAGAAYVPIDPAYPDERLAYLLADSAPVAVLTQASLQNRVRERDPAHSSMLVLDDPIVRTELAEQPDHDPDPQTLGLTPQHLAYVIYTSGSTGKPKGVAMPQAGLVNLLHWQQRQDDLPDGARTLQFAALGFDVAFQEIFATLTSGGCLVLIDEATRQDPAELVRLVRAQNVARLFLPFIALQAFAEAAVRSTLPLPALATVITAGEQLRVGPAIRQLFDRAPGCRLHNQYGPTESHVVTAQTLVDPRADWPELPPIGRPIANNRIRILDAHRQPVPIGVAGEIHIGGTGLARGYLHRPELTAERFVADPQDAQSHLYKTGDLGRWLPDGTIEYLGRNDFQVKIRGFRIELGEIEARLADCDGVREAAVAARDDGAGGKRLVAYAVMHDGADFSVAALRDALAARLPDYMVPGAFVALAALPIAPNGKLDRVRLPAPDETSVATRVYEAPVGDVEVAIAQIWQDLLALPRVGRHDDFFALGGHSLLAIQMTVRLRESMGVELSLKSLFDSPVLSQLADVAVAAQLDAFSEEDIRRMESELDALSEADLLAQLHGTLDHV
ncbi:non-ribosomal peptide synthetase [Tahibacter soli]|uniref:Amino acid adenylation domain-containing protein n=1 Tax=Tahibacter soli TaxID=2983605 RepID=A0A9X3YQN9_9GAMM|nr:non-ribosomal peptide synthetase [Tahibacter soli]MDC8016187.1 amino acid adenylation domain-containing protein [Tahibacter soli]